MGQEDFVAIYITLKLALIATLILIIIATPLAWWLRNNNTILKKIVSSLTALPMVLPPTVLGFYLLLFMGPKGPLGKLCLFFGLETWAFTFNGLVLGSVVFSFPFVLRPLQNAFEALGDKPIEIAYTLGASPLDAFFTVVVPLTKRAFITAVVLGFAHTLGEFGVILMIGGNIQGLTNVISMQIYTHVEAGEYSKAHYLSLMMLIFSFLILFFLNLFNSSERKNN